MSLCLGMACAGALEVGAIASDSTSFKFDANKTDEPILEQKEMFSLSAKQGITKDGFTYIAAEGMFSHTLDKKLENGAKAKNTFIADLSLFKISSLVKIDEDRKVDIAAGRFFIVDTTGSIFVQTCDGGRLALTLPGTVVTAYAGYTGLLNIKNNTIMESSGNVYSLKKEEDVYDFAAPYFVPMISVSFPYLVLNQSLTLEGAAAVPTEGPNKLDDKGIRSYITGSLNGPLSTSLFYNICESFSFMDGYFGSLSQFSLMYFTDLLSSSVAVNALYASNNFRGFTQQTMTASCNDLDLAAVFKPGLSISFVPVSFIFAKLGTDFVFDTRKGFDYYGWQFNGSADVQIFSDLKVNIGGSVFAGDKKDNNRVKITLGASLAL